MNRSHASSVGLLYSGGLDSSVLMARLLEQGREVQPIYVACGLHWEEPELRAARRFLSAVAGPRLRELAVLQMPVDDLYGDHWSVTGIGVPGAETPDEAVYLPGRNPLLLLKARLWCQVQGISQLALGCLGSNPFSDASEAFFVEFGALLDRATDGVVEILRPLASLSKQAALELVEGLPLEQTFSCIAPRHGVHCGRCNKCAERRAAFATLEWPDPTHYVSPLKSLSA